MEVEGVVRVGREMRRDLSWIRVLERVAWRRGGCGMGRETVGEAFLFDTCASEIPPPTFSPSVPDPSIRLFFVVFSCVAREKADSMKEDQELKLEEKAVSMCGERRWVGRGDR